MFGISAAYNLSVAFRYKGLLRRLDRAGIFVMIAGSYSPFVLVTIGGWLGTAVFLAVWCLAAVGLYSALCHPRRGEGLALALYLGMGWSLLTFIGRLADSVSTATLALLIAGGVLFTAGTGFYLAGKLPFHNAIWHAFVLAAAGCHYVAIYLTLRA